MARARYNSRLPHTTNMTLVSQSLHGFSEPVPKVVEILLLDDRAASEKLGIDVVEIVQRQRALRSHQVCMYNYSLPDYDIL